MSDQHQPPSAPITTTPAKAHEPEPAAPHGTVAEEAHHAEHSSHDPFARRVAITMVAIAAVLAGVKVLGHRAHNDRLGHQIEANVKHSQAGAFRTQADTSHTKANRCQSLRSVALTQAAAARTESANQWSYYQAKKLRQHFYEAQGALLTALGNGDSKVLEDWKANATRYGKEVEGIAKEARGWAATAKEHENEAAKLNDEAKHLEEEAVEAEHVAKEREEEAEKLREKSEHAHHRSNFYDLGEMGVELALVLCSVAILTKRPGFWYGGIVLGVAGALVAASGLFLH